MTQGSHAPNLSASAERMRRSRGLSCVQVELWRNEVDAPHRKLSELKEYISSASRQHPIPTPRSGGGRRASSHLAL